MLTLEEFVELFTSANVNIKDSVEQTLIESQPQTECLGERSCTSHKEQ